MRCTQCRKHDAEETWGDRIARWFAWHILPQTMRDTRSEGSIQRFEEGYEIGRKHERELNSLAFMIKTLEHKEKRSIDDILDELPKA